MANKAFVLASRIEGASSGDHSTIQLIFRYFLEDEDSVLVTTTQDPESSVFVDYSDGSHTLHDKIADKIRDREDDESIVVVFLDAPGHY